MSATKKPAVTLHQPKKHREKMNKIMARLKKKQKKERDESMREAFRQKAEGKKPEEIKLTPPGGFRKNYVDKIQKTVRIKRNIIAYLEEQEVKTGVTPVTAIAQIIENWFEQVEK